MRGKDYGKLERECFTKIRALRRREAFRKHIFCLKQAPPGPTDVVCIGRYVNRIKQYGVELTRLLAFGRVATGLSPIPTIEGAGPQIPLGLADGV